MLLEQSFRPAAFLGAPRGCRAPNATSQILPCCRTICCTLERQQAPSAVTPVAQMSLHRDQGPSQGSSVGTLPCHLVGLLSCTPRPQVSKQFINDNQVCLVIPHWEGCESTENNCLHLFLVLPCFPMGGWCWEMVKSSLSDKGCPEGPLRRDFISLKSLVSGQCL